LSVHAAAKGLLYGAAVVRSYLRDDQEFAGHFAEECSILVPETELKWSVLRPSQDTYDFSAADWLASFAEDRTMLMRGHTLVWHDSLPGWLKKTIRRDNASGLMLDHITKVVSHFAGRLHSWDVVNEAIDTGSDRPDRLRKTLWLDNCGSQYIEDAFRAAAAADPRAMLVYNEFGLDYDTSDNRDKRAAVLALLSNLRSRGVPVHALGIQAHLQAEQADNFNPEVLRRFIQQVADLGLQVLITELDVADRSLPANETARDGAVAAIYNSYLNAVLQEQAVSAVLTWGLSDRYTWMMHEPEREDSASPRPLPLDQDLERKPAWYAMASAFDNAQPRIRRGPGRHVQGIIAI
jgi:endo-1,4-beta-xylanase